MVKQTRGGVLIKDGGLGVDSGPLKARDVEFMLKGVDIHPTVKGLLCKLAETQHYNNSQLVQLAQMFDQMINTMNGIVRIAENMKGRTDELKKMMEGPTDESPIN